MKEYQLEEADGFILGHGSQGDRLSKTGKMWEREQDALGLLHSR